MIRMDASDLRSSTDMISTGWPKIPSCIEINLLFTLDVSVEGEIWENGGR